MPYRDQVAQLEYRLALAEKRAARATSSPRRRALFVVGALALTLVAAASGYALAPAGEDIPVLIAGGAESQGPRRQWTWHASRDGRECYLVADDFEQRHRADLARRLVLRLYCGEALVYETPQLRYGERHVGGCISQTGRTRRDHRLFCSERTVDRRGAQRGPALSVDSVSGVLKIVRESGEVQEWRLETRPYARARHRETVRSGLAPVTTFSTEAVVREISGSPMVHGIEIPRITGRSSCEVQVRSEPNIGLDNACALRVECDGVQLYNDEGYCFHRDRALQTFADYEPTWNSHRQGRRTPVAVLDTAVGVLRLADQDRLRGFSMTLEVQRPAVAVAQAQRPAR